MKHPTFYAMIYGLDRYQPTYEELKLISGRVPLMVAVSYQPTYEELKHYIRRYSENETTGYQPTYEELKLSFDCFLPWLPSRYQPTYEELKHDKISTARADRSVTSLPMRN